MYSFGVLYSFYPLNSNQSSINEEMANNEKPRVTTLTADLHVNYWELDEPKDSVYQFLDFGLLIKKVASDVDAIYFYFPFEIKESDIEDLGSRLNNEQMISALFNEDYNCVSNTGTPYTTVKRKGSEDVVFYLYELAKTNFSLENKSEYGSILKVSILSKPPAGSPANPDCNIYVRFRLKNIQVSNLFYEERISNDFVQNAFYKTRMLDFRINERREMNKKLLEILETTERHFVEFNKFHFFYVGSSKKEKVEGTVNYDDCRLLDYSKWSNYLPKMSNRDKKFLCYHWKKQNDTVFPSCSLFMRTIFKSLNFKIILLYSLIAIGLGFVGSALWGLLNIVLLGSN